MASIINKIHQQYGASLGEHLVAQCIDAGKIKLSDKELSQSHLFIIAGVGGETAISITSDILQQNPKLITSTDTNVAFLFSPNGQTFELRRYLQQVQFDCIAEEFISESGQHHEHIHIQLNKIAPQTRKITLLGHDIWSPITPEKRSYLNKQQQHYQKCWVLKGEKPASTAALGYLEILKSSTGGD